MQAIRNLAAGSMLRLSDLTPIDIIRKGDNVQLSVRAGALEITVTMLALENARLEQRVLLLNPESGEEIQGNCHCYRSGSGTEYCREIELRQSSSHNRLAG